MTTVETVVRAFLWADATVLPGNMPALSDEIDELVETHLQELFRVRTKIRGLLDDAGV